EEMHRKVKLLLTTAYCCQHDVEVLPFEATSAAFTAYRDQILDAERRLLYTLEMDVAVEHPYALIVDILRKWRDAGRFGSRASTGPELPMMRRAAEDIAFDIMTGELSLLFTAREVAVGAVWLAWHLIPLDAKY